MKITKKVFTPNQITKAAEVVTGDQVSKSYSEQPLRVGVVNVALRDVVGIAQVDTQTGAVPVVNYESTGKLSNLKSNGKFETVGIDDLGSVPFDLSSTGDGTGKLGIIVTYDEDVYEDSAEVIAAYSDTEHANRLTNTENAAICAALADGKTAVAVDPADVSAAVNANLCGKAKRRASIVTNNTGFAALDTVDASGNRLVTKTFDGRFVYAGKYDVLELDNEILPNVGTAAPVFVGDLAGACTLIYYREPETLENESIDGLSVKGKRYTESESALRLTASDKCYIYGTITKA